VEEPNVAKKEKEKKETPIEEVAEETPVEEVAEVDPWEEKYNVEHDQYLRLAAEFDNFRKRTTKEKEQSYGNGKADAVAKMLPVYDNLERALNQPTEDAAYKKGVEMTMTELVKILSGLGVEIFGEVGESFDPNLHNAVMHIENEELADIIEKMINRYSLYLPMDPYANAFNENGDDPLRGHHDDITFRSPWV
jgi:molecular chaperone GrpE